MEHIFAGICGAELEPAQHAEYEEMGMQTLSDVCSKFLNQAKLLRRKWSDKTNTGIGTTSGRRF